MLGPRVKREGVAGLRNGGCCGFFVKIRGFSGCKGDCMVAPQRVGGAAMSSVQVNRMAVNKALAEIERQLFDRAGAEFHGSVSFRVIISGGRCEKIEATQLEVTKL